MSKNAEALQQVGEIIRRTRKRRRITLDGLSGRSGINISSLSRIENGQRSEVDVLDLVAISAALGIDFDTLTAPLVGLPHEQEVA